MGAPSVFHYKTYKAYLRAWKESQNGGRGMHARLAEAAGCKSSYLSKVLSDKVQLTPEHALGLCRFLKLNRLESEMFLELLNLERAGTPELREYTLLKLADIKRQSEDLAQSRNLKRLEEAEVAASYYSHWLMSALHVLVSIPQHQTAELLSQHLGIDKKIVLTHLQQLKDLKLVGQRDNKFFPSSPSLHAAQGSAFSTMHLSNWRSRSLASASQGQGPHELHFSGLYSLSRSDFEKFAEQLKLLLGELNDRVKQSKEEVAACFNLDWFFF